MSTNADISTFMDMINTWNMMRRKKIQRVLSSKDCRDLIFIINDIISSKYLGENINERL